MRAAWDKLASVWRNPRASPGGAGDVSARVDAELRDADAGVVTSFCADGRAASAAVLASSAAARCFYDLDTPVALDRGESVSYLPDEGLRDFDLVLSYTGGRALDKLRRQAGARHTVALYGSVDPDVHRGSTVTGYRRAFADVYEASAPRP
jgi:hypothetical protein